MRTIWTILSVLAVANLLALAALIGWLSATDRLARDRLRTIREMLSETITDQEIRERAEAEEAAVLGDSKGSEVREVALSSEELIDRRLDRIEIDRLRRERLEEQASDLRASLVRQERALAERRGAFEAEVEAFRAEQERIRATDGDRQFKKAVKILDGLRPKEGVQLIRALMDGAEMDGTELDGSDPSADLALDAQDPRRGGMARAVSYLNAMQERTRLKLMGELAKGEPELAAILLERLRTRGVPPAGGRNPPLAQAP